MDYLVKFKNKYGLNDNEYIQIKKISDTKLEIIDNDGKVLSLEYNKPVNDYNYDSIFNLKDFIYKFIGENSLTYLLDQKIFYNYTNPENPEYNKIIIFKLDKFLLEDSELENKIGNCKIIKNYKRYKDYNYYYNVFYINCDTKNSDNILTNYRVTDIDFFQSQLDSHKRELKILEKFQKHKGYLLLIIFFKNKLKPLKIIIPNYLYKDLYKESLK